MKFQLFALVFSISLFGFCQSTELVIKSDLRIVIYEGDQYKKWYGQFHQNDLLTSSFDENDEGNPLKPYELKWEKKKSKARKKELKAKVYHEAIIPIEIIFKMNSDSLPVPVITSINVSYYEDSLIKAEFSEISFDNASPEFGNGYCSFRFYFDITNKHFAKNQNKLKVNPKQMGFSGHINFKDGEKDGINAGYAGNIYSRGDYSIYKINGKTYSYIPLFYRHQNDFENKLNAFEY